MRRTVIFMLTLLATFVSSAQNVNIEFFTPSIVHVVKYPTEVHNKKASLVVTAAPENVSVTRKGNTLSSSELSVKLDEKTGCVTFMTAKGKMLLREKDYQFKQRKTGNDAGRWTATQRFVLQRNEAVYGLGTLQNGKLNRRGEHIRMEQENLQMVRGRWQMAFRNSRIRQTIS